MFKFKEYLNFKIFRICKKKEWKKETKRGKFKKKERKNHAKKEKPTYRRVNGLAQYRAHAGGARRAEREHVLPHRKRSPCAAPLAVTRLAPPAPAVILQTLTLGEKFSIPSARPASDRRSPGFVPRWGGGRSDAWRPRRPLAAGSSSTSSSILPPVSFRPRSDSALVCSLTRPIGLLLD
jgi:hypothetical protein